MKDNKKILGRIIAVTIITMLAAGFYLYLGRNNKVDVDVKPEPPEAQKVTGEAQNKSQDADAGKNDGTIDLIRPPFLDE
jgi:hypothetical protein